LIEKYGTSYEEFMNSFLALCFAEMGSGTLYNPNYRTSSLKKGKIEQVGRQSYQSPLKEVDKKMSHTLPSCILIFNGREIKWKI